VTDGACLELAGKVPKEGTRAIGEEEMLVRRAQRGDRVAFDALVRLHDQKVLRLVMQIVRTPELAKDLYQEAFLKAYRALGNFRFESSFSTWLYRVATNVCLDYLRRQGNREEISTKPGEDGEVELIDTVAEGRPDLNPEHALRAREIGRRIEAALQGLTPRERVVFELRHYQGLRLRAIGELCGTTEETAKNCLFRATQKLRAALEDLADARKRE
jgi:RNA polymerase sigma-70 factor (ECF subfamily)